MSINLQGRKLVIYGGVLAVLGLVLGGVSFWRIIHEKAPQIPLAATFSLEKAMKALPQWGRYEQVNLEIEQLQDKLAQLGLIANNSKAEGVGLLGSQPPLDDPNAMFQLDIENRRNAMINSSRSWQKELVRDIKAKVEEKANQLQAEMKDEVTQQQAVYARKIKDYQQEIEFDYSLKLTNYDFKLKTPGLSDAEKALLLKEMQSVKEEMTNLLDVKKAEFAKAMESFTKQRQQSISEELNAYQGELRSQFEQQSREKSLLMEKEFGNWLNQEKRLYQVKMEKRQKQHFPELLKLKSLSAERELLRLQMVSTIKRKLKILLEEQEMDIVLINPSNGFKATNAILSFIQGKDITDEIVNALR